VKQTIVTIYALVLCGISTIAFTGYTGTAIFQLIKHSAPMKFVDSGEKVRLSSNDLYWQSIEDGRSALAIKGRPSESDLTTRRNARLQAVVLDIQTNSLSEFISNTILAVVFALIGFGHFLIYRCTARAV
jgi:hypothetical protein